jgi:hypothetical protein
MRVMFLLGSLPGQADLYIITVQNMLIPLHFNGHRAVPHPEQVLLL